MALLAHVGHWSAWVVYLGPVVVVAVWLGIDRLRGGSDPDEPQRTNR
jgi:hypothetical protein